MTLREVTDSFETCRDAFNRLDGDAVADLRHEPFGTGCQLLRTAAGPKVLLAPAFEEDFQEMKRHAAQ